MKRATWAIIKKDFGEAMSNSMAKVALILVPLMMVLVFPVMMTAMAVLAPEEMSDMGPMLTLLPIRFGIGEAVKAGYYYVMNYLVPAFFLIVPIMAASVASGSSFAGEKERRTLETLLFCPLTVRQLFQAKVLGAFLLAMLVTLISFLAFAAVAAVGSVMIYGSFVLNPGIWAAIMLLIVPAVALVAITVMVLASARAKTFQEAQQYAALLIVPVMLVFVMPQIAGLFLYGPLELAGIGAAVAAVGLALMRLAAKAFTAEKLLR